MSNNNHGIGYVDPGSGSDGNNGFWWDSAKQTLGAALSAGFGQIEVLSGSHTVSTITYPVELRLHAGTHSFYNAPVTCSAPIGLVSAGTLSPTEDGSAFITAPTQVSDFFQLTNGTSNLDGGNIYGLTFDTDKFSRSAIYTSNVSYLVAQSNSLIGTAWASRSMFYTTVTAGGQSSYCKLDGNRVVGNQLLVVRNDNKRPMNGWVVRANRCYGLGQATAPFLDAGGTNGQYRGWAVVGNSFEDTDSGAAAVYFSEPTNQLYWYGNRGGGLNNPNNLIFQADNLASAYVEQSLGDVSADGNIKVNGQIYSNTAPNTGVDGRGGRDDYVGAQDVRIVIMGRY